VEVIYCTTLSQKGRIMPSLLRRHKLNLETGSLFLYRGPWRFFAKPGVAPGQVLGFDEPNGIVFVSILREQDSGTLARSIDFLPIIRSQLMNSIAHVADVRPTGDGHYSALQEWRARHIDGSAGAFAVPLWKAEASAWETVYKTEPGLDLARVVVNWAFPKLGPGGRYDTVQVGLTICLPDQTKRVR
jgi:hypothetical protein